ncbi:MAG: pyrophosphatase [Vicinamibacterales bacterium]
MQEFVSLNQYQGIAAQTDQNKDAGLDALGFFLLGLFGEVGTLLSALKKKQRDRESFIGYREAVQEEFGDAIWYFSNIATRASLHLSVIAQRAFRGLEDWDQVSVDKFGTFGDVQGQCDASASSPQFEESVIALAGKVGLLLNDFHLGRVVQNRDALSGHLVDIFRALLASAHTAGVDLGEVAAINIKKIQSRWPDMRRPTALFDDSYDSLEQLPRRIRMHIFERSRGKRTAVIQQCNGINIGDRLTDNKMVDDDYRFHDVFHLANAAVLGWSPVLRALFRVKRKSNPAVDEAQDGARAILIEEGLSTLIFHRALRLNHFDGLGSLDYPLLKLIPEFVSGFEVEQCALWEWERAILEGYRVFRQLKHHRRGIVTADLLSRSISFERLQE